MPKGKKGFLKHTNNVFTCDMCNKSFTSSSEKFMLNMMRLHNKVKHGGGEYNAIEHARASTSKTLTEMNLIKDKAKLDIIGITSLK